MRVLIRVGEACREKVVGIAPCRTKPILLHISFSLSLF